ncbi:MAG: cell division ATP-binding protein FtsE [Candidatus Curtissbacteria bacterium]|nr:cell division ATP-binding protein FtsE [Candidatus Curtissbacteria bacterium]
MNKISKGSVHFEKVTKKFGNICALEEISFDVQGGEFVFLTGPSGAGKTTITKLILRELLPTSGHVKIDDTEVSRISNGKIPQFRRKIGVVFQDFRLLFDRTVFENVALPLQVVNLKKDEIKKRVDEILELVGLQERAHLFPRQLAGGELQRVCLALAIINRPEIVLADEPTGNLDPATSWQIVKLLKKINKMGTTILMSTHNVDIVNSLKERVIKLEKGKLIKTEDEGKYESV